MAKIEKLKLKSRRPYPSQFDMLNSRLAKIEQNVGVLTVMMDEIIMKNVMGDKYALVKSDLMKQAETNGKSP